MTFCSMLTVSHIFKVNILLKSLRHVSMPYFNVSSLYYLKSSFRCIVILSLGY